MATGVYVVAEAGVNHNGSLNLALQLIDAAADGGADAVKFQTFRAEHLVTASAEKAEYQQKHTGGSRSQKEMLAALELSFDDHAKLQAHCRERGVDFLSTPFDIGCLHLLARELDVPRIKISSGDLTNGPLLLALARTGKPCIISTGMARIGTVDEALRVLAFGYLTSDGNPTGEGLDRAYYSPDGWQLLRERVALLHCTTEYPTPPAHVNLRALDTLRAAFGLQVGLSDHTAGIAIAIAAVARGATIIEKHLTLDHNMPGPDHQASLEPAELAQLVAGIRDVEVALGSGEKVPGAEELKNAPVVCKSLVALQSIRHGETFDETNLGVKRPGTGVSPMGYWRYLGRSAARDYQADEVIEP